MILPGKQAALEFVDLSEAEAGQLFAGGEGSGSRLAGHNDGGGFVAIKFCGPFVELAKRDISGAFDVSLGKFSGFSNIDQDGCIVIQKENGVGGGDHLVFPEEIVEDVLDQKNGHEKERAGHQVVIADKFKQLIRADIEIHEGVRYWERLI